MWQFKNSPIVKGLVWNDASFDTVTVAGYWSWIQDMPVAAAVSHFSHDNVHLIGEDFLKLEIDGEN